MIYKNPYKPRFRGYWTIRSLILIADGLVSFALSPFGLTCQWYNNFCDWNITKDIRRMRENRLAREKPKGT